MNYLEVLEQLHERLQPPTYLEIGVSGGRSLRLSHSRRTIGIDPGIRPAVQESFSGSPGVALFALPSDAFFAKHPRESVLQDARIDFAFIDGLHRYDQVLRDFINVERWCAPSGTIVLHDVIPFSEEAAARERVPGVGAWTGDVWQIVSCLRDYRPDLDCLLVRASPSGLLIVRNLDSSSDVLTTHMDDILRSAPKDGEQYLTALRTYLSNVSPISSQEAFARLSSPTPSLPANVEPPTAPGAGPLCLADEPTRVGRHIVRFSGGFLTASSAPDRYDWKIDGISRPLVPDDFSFYGFDDLLPDIEFELSRVSLRSGPRVATIVENAVLVPGDLLSGGVLDAHGHVVPETRTLRRGGRDIVYGLPEDVDINPESELDEEVVFFGPDITHFGHFLLEGLARSWILSNVDASVPVVFQSPLTLTPGNWRTDLLRALGITEDRVLQLRQPTRIRRLIVPEPLYDLAHVAHERTAEPHRAAADAILGRGGAGSSDQPVYLSRRLISPGTRFQAGEAQLEEVLHANGFVVAHPETMSLADQIRLYNRHADIFATRGSAAHAAALFSRNRPRVHVLTGPARNINRDFFLTMAVSGAQATFVNSMEVSPVGRLLHPSTVAQYLADRGLLKESFTAKIATSSTLLRQEFEEWRLYVCIRDAMLKDERVLDEVLDQAKLLAKDFWPLSLLLARHQTSTNVQHAEDLIRQFILQVAAERDLGRLINFRKDVQRFAPQVASACNSELASALAQTAATHFALDLPSLMRVRERQFAQGAENAV